MFRVLVEGADLKPVRTVYSPDGLKVYRTPDDAACVALQARHLQSTLMILPDRALNSSAGMRHESTGNRPDKLSRHTHSAPDSHVYA